MLTVIIRRTDEPNVVQLTQELIMQELSDLNGSEMLLEDKWSDGLKKVRTRYFCLVEPDCILNSACFVTNLSIFGRNVKGEKGRGKGGGGYTKLAMLSPALCVNNYRNRIYGYTIDNELRPERQSTSTEPYHIQIASILGAIIRYSSVKDALDVIEWDDENLVRLSAELSLYLWNTGRRIKVNPRTDYVSTDENLENPGSLPILVPTQVRTLFDRSFDILNNPKVLL